MLPPQSSPEALRSFPRRTEKNRPSEPVLIGHRQSWTRLHIWFRRPAHAHSRRGACKAVLVAAAAISGVCCGGAKGVPGRNRRGPEPSRGEGRCGAPLPFPGPFLRRPSGPQLISGLICVPPPGRPGLLGFPWSQRPASPTFLEGPGGSWASVDGRKAATPPPPVYSWQGGGC